MDMKKIQQDLTNESTKELVREFCQISNDFRDGKSTAQEAHALIAPAKHALQTIAIDLALNCAKQKSREHGKRLEY